MACTNLGNLSKSGCAFNPDQIAGWVIAPDITGMDFATSQTLVGWNAKLILSESERWRILMPKAPLEVVPTQEDAIIEKRNTSSSEFIRDGYLSIKCVYSGLSIADKNALRVFNNLETYAYTVTRKEIFGGLTSTNFIPVPVKIYVTDYKVAADNNTSWTVEIMVEYLNTTGNFDYVVETTKATIPWYPLTQLTGVINVLFTAISSDISDNEFIFSAWDYKDQDQEITDIPTANPEDIEVYLVSTDVALTAGTMTKSANIYTYKPDVGTPLTASPYGVRLKSVELQAGLKKYETVADSNEITPVA